MSMCCLLHIVQDRQLAIYYNVKIPLEVVEKECSAELLRPESRSGVLIV